MVEDNSQVNKISAAQRLEIKLKERKEKKKKYEEICNHKKSKVEVKGKKRKQRKNWNLRFLAYNYWIMNVNWKILLGNNLPFY